MRRITKILCPLFLLMGCASLEKSEQEKARRQNAKGEYIQRGQQEYLYNVEAPKAKTREKYPWED